MSLRLTITAAVAVLLASLSLNAVIAGNGWLGAGIGAIIVVSLAGIVTRLSNVPCAVTTTFLVLIGVVPLLSGPHWTIRITGLVIVLLTAASVTGTRLLRGFAIAAAYLACLLIYLNLLFSSARSFGHVIPTYHSMAALLRVWRGAFTEFGYSPPIPDIRPVSLVAAAGIGGIAILVDVVAVRLRRPAIAGLPLLLLFSVPVASNLKAFGVLQTAVFAAGLAGYLALLSADGRDRLRMWGRLVTFRYVQSADETGSGPDTRELAASGRRIGLVAVCLAVVIPIVLPSTHVHDVFGTTNNGTGQGGSSLNELLRVQDQLTGKPTAVLSYTTTSADPTLQYLQVFTLNYNANLNAWLPQFGVGDKSPDGNKLPYAVPGQIRGTRVTEVLTKIQMSADQTGEAILPLPYAPVQLRIPGSGWTETPGSLMVFNPVESLAKLTYTVVSHEATPDEAEIKTAAATAFMPAAIQTQYGTYSGPDANQLAAIARKQTLGAATQLQQAEALQDWLTSRAFTYTLKPNLPQAHWLLKFLTTHRRGFCSQFAWAFAVLARLLNIPARIATGYTGGSAGPHGVYQVTTEDAHAWPELYFPGEGWLRFEPTPAGGHGQGTATVPTYARGKSGTVGLPPATNPGPRPSSTAGGSQAGKKSTTGNRLTHQPGTAGGSLGRGRTSGLLLAIGIPVLLFLLIAWPALTRLITRRRRWLAASGDAGHADAAWRELTDDLADYGLACPPDETPRGVGRRLAREASLAEPAVQAVTRIAAAEERARYARTALPGDGLAADVRAVRRAVAASVSRKQRLRARLLPPSTMTAARLLLERAGGLFNWLDTSWPALRQQVRRTLSHRPG